MYSHKENENTTGTVITTSNIEDNSRTADLEQSVAATVNTVRSKVYLLCCLIYDIPFTVSLHCENIFVYLLSISMACIGLRLIKNYCIVL